MEALRTRADAYVADGLLTLESAKKIIEVIEQERRAVSYLNDGGEGQQEPQQSLSSNMNAAELRAELCKREALMQQGAGGDGITDQVGGKENKLRFSALCNIIFRMAFHQPNGGSSLLRDHRLPGPWPVASHGCASQRRNWQVVPPYHGFSVLHRERSPHEKRGPHRSLCCIWARLASINKKALDSFA